MTTHMPDPVLIVGHINHDRIWRLTESLRPGGRISWQARETRLGGGGYFTARYLLDLGHPVSLLSNLMCDGAGNEAFAALQAAGFDTRLICRRSGATDFADILLDPGGERTILSSQRRLARRFELEHPVSARAIYINAPALPDALHQSIETCPLVLSQFPLRDAQLRSADVMIGSRADLSQFGPDEIWMQARNLCGERLKHLVLTDGPGDIAIHDGASLTTISLPRRVEVTDTIGAGDTYSAALLHALLDGQHIRDAAERAAKLAADWLENRPDMTRLTDPDAMSG